MSSKKQITSYEESFSLNKLWKYILLVAIAYVLYSINKYWIIEHVVEGFFSAFPENGMINFFCLLLVTFGCIKLYKHVKARLVPPLNSLIVFFMVTAFYLTEIRLSQDYKFYSFSDWGLCGLKYADIVFFVTAFLCIDFRSYNVLLEKNEYYSLIQDEADPDIIEDLISNDAYVKNIERTINSTASKASFAIGLFSSWGAGKTDFLKRLKKELEKNVNENIVIEFNPWKAASPDAILQDYFIELSNSLKTFNRTITGKLKSYSNKILTSARDFSSRAAGAFIDEYLPDRSLQQEYNQINNMVASTGKRVVIIIDDLDRLSGAEIMQVLRIIRNSANFHNTIFVVAVDHDYIVEVLKGTKLFAKEDHYLKKIFQLTISLPQIQKNTFQNEIIKLLIKEQAPLSDPERETIREVVGSTGTHIVSMMSNYRDVKRFCNAFKIAFDALRGEVEVRDLFLLELIRANSVQVYEAIASKSIITLNESNPVSYILDDSKWNTIFKSDKLNNLSKDELYATVKELVETREYKGHRQVSYPRNFHLYFCYQLFDLISLKDITSLEKLNAKEIRSKFDEWEKENKGESLNTMLSFQSDYKDSDELMKYITVFALGDERDNITAVNKIRDVSQQPNRYYEELQEFKKEINALFDNTILTLYKRANIAHSIFDLIRTKSMPELFTLDELKEIILKLFKEYVNNQTCYTPEMYDFYILNVDSHDARHFVHLTSDATKVMSHALQNKEYLKEYLRYIIRSYSLPNDGQFVFAPYTSQIFNGWQKFRIAVDELMDGTLEIDESLNGIMPFIYKGIDEYENGKQSFQLEGAEKDKMLEYLRTTRQYNFLR